MAGIDLQIFDRNGSTVYEGNTGWDGRYHGRVLDPDTYFYLIQYKDRNKKTKTMKGYITLVR
jgi:gliding motility-associated-like protein